MDTMVVVMCSNIKGIRFETDARTPTYVLSIDLSNNDREGSDESGNPVICFVCDPMCQIRKMNVPIKEDTLAH